jgi:hypothetical protein
MGTLNPFKTCQQWVNASLELSQTKADRYVNEGKDDEEEFVFKGIPIAGENEGDSEDSWESEIFGHDATDDCESEEEETSSDTCPFTSLNSMATEDIAFKVGPVKDGIVRFEILPTIPLTPNYYRHLPEITDSLTRYHGTFRPRSL